MDFSSECSDSIAEIYVRAKCFTARLLRLYFGFGRRSFEPREEATKAGIAFSTTPKFKISSNLYSGQCVSLQKLVVLKPLMMQRMASKDCSKDISRPMKPLRLWWLL